MISKHKKALITTKRYKLIMEPIGSLKLLGGPIFYPNLYGRTQDAFGTEHYVRVTNWDGDVLGAPCVSDFLAELASEDKK